MTRSHGIASRVRTLLEILSSDGVVIPIGSTGTVLGYQGEKLLVEFEDYDTGEKHTATAEVWEVLRT